MIYFCIVSGDLDLKICQNFVGTKFFLAFVGGINLYGGAKIIWGINILLAIYFHYLISLETPNTPKSKVFLLRISLGKLNASEVVTCQYPQTYKKSPSEKLHFLCFLTFYLQVCSIMYIWLPQSMNGLIVLCFYWKNINEIVGEVGIS